MLVTRTGLAGRYSPGVVVGLGRTMRRSAWVSVCVAVVASVATISSSGSHALVTGPFEPIEVRTTIKAVDATGRFVIVPGTGWHPSGLPTDRRYDRLTGETIEIDPVDAASADLRFAITRGETFPHTDPRWLEIDTGVEHPIPIPLPPGYYISALDLSADGRLLLATTKPNTGVDSSLIAVYVVSIDGAVDRSPVSGVAAADLSPNGRWVLLRGECPPPLLGSFCSQFSRWDRATGAVEPLPVRSGSVTFAIGDEGQVLDREAMGPVDSNGLFPSRIVRRAVGGQVFEVVPVGDAESPFVVSADASAIAFVDQARRTVIVDATTAVRTVEPSFAADPARFVIAPNGSFVMTVASPPGVGATTADLTLVSHAGRPTPPRLRAGETYALPVIGRSGVPFDATSVVLNATVTNPDGPGFVVAWPCDEPRPDASNVNVTAARQTVANSVIAKIATTGADAGAVCLFSSVATDLVVDVQGWFTGDVYRGVVPDRLIDTRAGDQDDVGNVAGGGVVPISVVGGVGPAGASAVVLNVTLTNTGGPGFATLWPCDEPRPDASNVNVTGSGQTVANAVVAKVGAAGTVCVFTSTSADVIVDLQGHVAGAAYDAIVPVRALDSRNGESDSLGNVAANSTVRLPLAGVAGVPADAVAVVVNVTVTNPSGPGFATVWPCDEQRPDASNVNVTGAGQTVANAVVAKVASTGPWSGSICLAASVDADLIVDVQGSFTGAAYTGIAPARFLDTRG